MSSSQNQYNQGRKDANQGKGPKNTHGMRHQDANAYNAGLKQGNNGGKK